MILSTVPIGRKPSLQMGQLDIVGDGVRRPGHISTHKFWEQIREFSLCGRLASVRDCFADWIQYIGTDGVCVTGQEPAIAKFSVELDNGLNLEDLELGVARSGGDFVGQARVNGLGRYILAGRVELNRDGETCLASLYISRAYR